MSLLQQLQAVSIITSAQIITLTERNEKAFTEEQWVQYQANSKELDLIHFTYKVHDEEMIGYCCVSKEANSPPLIPIIYNRGGYKGFSTLTPRTVINGAMGVLAKEGYFSIGSTYVHFTKNIKDEYGGGELESVLALKIILDELELVNSTKIGMYGASRGGMMTYLAMKAVNWIDVAVIVSGLVDLTAIPKERPKLKEVFDEAFGGSDGEMQKRSVIFWADKLKSKAPILILHGQDDEHVNVTHALKAMKALSKAQNTTKLVIFENDNHFLHAHIKERNTLFTQWFNDYLH